MEPYERVVELIYDAIDQVNEMSKPEQALKRSPDTVLFGKSTRLDSLGLVNLVATVEENVQLIFRKQISLIDIMMGVEGSQWTVARLAETLTELVDPTSHGQGRAQVQTRI